jgi:hypothetical protein
VVVVGNGYDEYPRYCKEDSGVCKADDKGMMTLKLLVVVGDDDQLKDPKISH